MGRLMRVVASAAVRQLLQGVAALLLLAAGSRGGVAAQNDSSGLYQDTQGLLSFKERIERDPSGVLSGWAASASSNSCDWRGVICANGRVAAINLTNCGLLAPLPTAALAPLDQLQEMRLGGNEFYGSGIEQVVASACATLSLLDLSSNNLTGSFSASDNVVCSTLTYLNLSRNSLRGSLSSFGALRSGASLASLDLSYNNFSGLLPSDLFSACNSLLWLDLSHNSLSGSLPAGISLCAALQHLDLSHNLLNSTLPADMISPAASSRINNSSLLHLNLSTNQLSGPLPDSFNSAHLVSLDLSANHFVGPIPPSISTCTSLRLLNLSVNSLTGPLPASFSSLTNLQGLYLSDNTLTGSIPAQLGTSFVSLKELDLSINQLVGTIPASFSNCSSLYYMNLGRNVLSGEFPETVVCAMPSLQTLIMSFNNLTGPLPAALPDCYHLAMLDLSANEISGRVPDTFCAPQLKQLLLQDNKLTGAVPAGLGNCSSLTILDLSCNLLGGTLPSSLPSLPFLQELMIWGNFLEGPIPPNIGTAIHLRKLILNINLLSGTIPPTLANCSNLEWLSLSSNFLTGSIPMEVGSMPKIGILQLANNSFSGNIPATLGNGTTLIWLDLNNNLLDGNIPAELAKQAGKITKGTLNQGTRYAYLKNLGPGCKGLGGLLEYSGIRDETVLQLSNVKECNLTRLYFGTDPYYFPTTGSLQYLDLAFNQLSGSIPVEIGSLSYLLVLSLSHNALTGTIPDSLSNLVRMTILYLDHNMLQGSIPSSLAKLGLLNQLDLSNNNLTGPIPDSGTMSTMPATVFANNPGLCGAPLLPCGGAPTPGDFSSNSNSASKAGRWSGAAIAMSSLGAFALVTACACGLAACFLGSQRRSKQHVRDSYINNLPSNGSGSWNISGASEPLSINVATFETPLRKLTFAHLLEATNGFSSEAIIGRGGFGDVYKATLEGGAVVAIKKLIHTVGQGDREFMAEMETIGKIKHRNLVPLLGYCRVGQERLLVYEYMEGGSLDKRLHDDCNDDREQMKELGSLQHEVLSWEMRKRIVLGTARGLCFLHHSCIPHVIHRDLKSSNVLLDDALEARVSDFGMARLVSAAETHLSVSSVVGTPGYVPPEYCHSFRCTTKGDVYSFGVVLLELITGKRPTWSSSSSRASKPEAFTSSITGSTTETSGTTTTTATATPKAAAKEEYDGGVDLVGWVKRQLTEGKEKELLDQEALASGGGAMAAFSPPTRLATEKEMLRYLEIACWCVEQSPWKRPNMLQVMALLRELHQQQDLDSLQ